MVIDDVRDYAARYAREIEKEIDCMWERHELGHLLDLDLLYSLVAVRASMDTIDAVISRYIRYEIRRQSQDSKEPRQ